MLFNHLTTRANYDRLSRWYDFLSGSSERSAKAHGLQLLDIQSGERILEIGCGTGETLFRLASATGSTGYLFGLDLSAGMLQKSKNRLKKHDLTNYILIHGDSLQLPFGSSNFDAIFMSFTLELFPFPEMPILLNECKRVLFPGGRMAVVSLLQKEYPGCMETVYTWAHQRWPAVFDCHPIPLKDILSDAGFTITTASETSIGGLPAGIILASKSKK